jgi:OmpR family response regulator RpaB
LSSIKKITNRVLGLELGADDYLTKPFSGKELEIKISSILRRTLKTESFEDKLPVRIKDLTFSKINKEVFRDGKKVNLTSMELSLLELLIENAGVTLSRTSILNNVWGYKPERTIDTRLVDLYIFRLRSKLKLNGQYPDYISTVRGIGYVFQKK